MKREMFLALILLGLTTTAEGTAPFNRPHLYPVIVLSDK